MEYDIQAKIRVDLCLVYSETILYYLIGVQNHPVCVNIWSPGVFLCSIRTEWNPPCSLKKITKTIFQDVLINYKVISMMVALQILHDLDQSLLHAKNKKNISICTVYYTQRHGFPPNTLNWLLNVPILLLWPLPSPGSFRWFEIDYVGSKKIAGTKSLSWLTYKRKESSGKKCKTNQYCSHNLQLQEFNKLQYTIRICWLTNSGLKFDPAPPFGWSLGPRL
jgi:hypothetical protein